jgi:light-regulated signal transduction histidine kinase (bacteriophytochrome)
MIDHKKELEDFVYTVSHDLCAPLRHIREFSKILLETLEGRLSEEEREYFDYILTSTNKANKIMTALLQYSRLNTEVQEFVNFDFSELLEEVVHSFTSEIKQKKAVVKTVDMPPTLTGDRHQIEQLFMALMSNALIFHTDKTNPPKIKITAKHHDDEWLFTVVDNGIGIDAEYHEDVFKILKRLDPETYPQGMGVGLTIAKKIVQRHGGKIWIESELGKGTKVLFTLKNKP